VAANVSNEAIKEYSDTYTRNTVKMNHANKPIKPFRKPQASSPGSLFDVAGVRFADSLYHDK